MKDNQQIELADLLVKKIVAEEVDKKYQSNVCELKDMVSLCFEEVSTLANQVNNIAPALFNIPKSDLESQLQPSQQATPDEKDKLIEELETELQMYRDQYSLFLKKYGESMKSRGLGKAREELLRIRRSIGQYNSWRKRRNNQNLVNGHRRKETV